MDGEAPAAKVPAKTGVPPSRRKTSSLVVFLKKNQSSKYRLCDPQPGVAAGPTR